MTPDKLPQEIADKIKTDASAAYTDVHGFVAYTKGATAWAHWKVKHDELSADFIDLGKRYNATQATMTYQANQYQQLRHQAERMLDALEQIAKEANNSPEDTWGEIAVRMKRIAIIQLQQFKGGKGKEVVNEG